jgi:parallel beta-helix repeat protein
MMFAVLLLFPIAFALSETASPKSRPCLNLQGQVETATKQGAQQINLQPGRVCVSSGMRIIHAHNLTIDGHGASLVFSPTISPAIDVTAESDGITLRNFSIDYDPLPFTQARITGVLGPVVQFTTDAGYPSLASLGHLDRAYLFDPKTRLWKQGGATLYPVSITPRAGGGWMLLKPKDIFSVKQGDLVAFAPRHGAAIMIDGLAKNIKVENVAILASPGMGLMARYTSGATFSKLRVERGPPPAGATTGRLLSTNADAFNYGYSRRGPTLEASEFAFQGDDGVNLHGLVMPIVRGGARTDSFIAMRPYKNDVWPTRAMQPGDPVRLLAQDTFAILATAHLKTIERVDGDPQSMPFQGTTQLYPLTRATRDTAWTFYRITLSESVPATPGAFADFPALSAPHFTIRNNHFHDSRGHAIVVGSSDGAVRDNTIERVTQNAITVGPHYAPWLEGGWVDHVVIEGNVVSDVCADLSIIEPGSWAYGAISVGAELGKATQYPLGNRSISITGNAISGCSGPGIYLNAASDIVTKNNRFRQVGERFDLSGMTFPLSAYDIAVGNIHNATIE